MSSKAFQRAACDLDIMTERRGSPHTLVATKNQASYERRAKAASADLEHVSRWADDVGLSPHR